jgi:Cu(I)/Ag(I) efflux system membrane fusion protein
VKTGTAALAAAAMLALGVAGGYWWANRTSHNAPVVSPAPAAAITSGATAGDAAKPARKLRFYRNPMGLPDTSPTPKKDPMGMDYIPVYEGEDDAADDGKTVKISVDRVQKLGVRTEPAALRMLDRNVRALGRVEIDERRVVAVAPKFEGWVEKLLVNATGQPVAKGQPLFEVYSPELVSAQREYAIAVKGVEALKDAGGDAQAGMSRLAESSLARLRNWDIPDEQVKELVGSGTIRRTLTFRSPAGGIVLEKKALQGMRFMPGEALFQIADLSAVWIIADVFEQDLGQVRVGSMAKLRFNAYPGKTFDGRITYIYPTLKPETRTVPIRIELANPGQQLKPAMFAEIELPVGTRAKVVTVPTSAVIDSGTRRIVFVQRAEGRFEPREVKLGARSDTHVEILDGVKEGEPIVTAANFLIDAESNLKAAIGGFGSATTTGASDAAKVGHKGHGSVVAIDAKGGTLSIKHDPVPSLKWPAMTMEFVPANPSLLQGLNPGSTLDFEFVERKPGEWVITSIAPAGAVAAPAKANPHAGH